MGFAALKDDFAPVASTARTETRAFKEDSAVVPLAMGKLIRLVTEKIERVQGLRSRFLLGTNLLAKADQDKEVRVEDAEDIAAARAAVSSFAMAISHPMLEQVDGSSVLTLATTLEAQNLSGENGRIVRRLAKRFRNAADPLEQSRARLYEAIQKTLAHVDGLIAVSPHRDVFETAYRQEVAKQVSDRYPTIISHLGR